MRHMIRAGVWLALSLAAAGCTRGANGAGAADDLVARADARRYELTGTVVRVDIRRRTAAIEHDRIPDYMDAMTMEFRVKEEWAIRQMAPGDRVRASLVVDGARSWIEGTSITKASGVVTSGKPLRGSWVPADPGTPLPDVSLVDQDGKPFTLDRYRGRVLLITFSFTRCPLPDYCPLMMKHFASIERQTVKTTPLSAMRLLTVTLDPAYDTPAVLRAYGEKHVAGDGPSRRFTRWHLATGDAAEIKKLAVFFGLDYLTENDRIIHSLRTAIVDPDGRVVKVFEGNEWTVEDVMRELRALPVSPARAS